ncbi:DUF3465 domain-containing protein [Desulfofustis limnaeus]|jgi:hypothetical protein|uniref:DUF3465 domain-containing protein n=1 Tax=Desulfofustis limnaeus TaxID=2740163 RepID=A0ABM7W908_9BACT|nr:DUF3465 domain-containing protein [Desulfofustis limnaeus]MDX9894884.1 DUF3465 domain-containing protein [Desulfofustis sp.]BDD87478.1 hypothetical protein DPPLL_18430 [Desulfofustis limnaeus]
MKPRRSKILFVLVLALVILQYGYQRFRYWEGLPKEPASWAEQLEQAYETKRSSLQIAGRGEVMKLLTDDLQGSRHQRFILQIPTGLTLLVSHNIDLAPRLDSLQVGDTIEFFGVYEYNDKGGVIHWTHHDPQGRHPDGWLKHRGRTYQ